MSDVIQLGMSADDGQLVAALTNEREELKETESAFERFGNVVSSAMQKSGEIAVGALREVGSALHTVTHSGLQAFGAAMGAAAARIYFARSAIATLKDNFGSYWGQMRLGLTAATWFAPWLKIVTASLTIATAATIAYRSANDDLIAKLNQSIFPVNQTVQAWGELKDAGNEVSRTLRAVGADIADVSVAWATQVAELSGYSRMLRNVDDLVGTVVGSVANHLSLWAQGIQIITDATMDLVDANGASAASLRDMAAASEALIAKQEMQADLFGQLQAMQEAAVDQAQHAGEMQRIASLATVDAINAEVTALQQKAAAAILAGDATAESQKKTAELFAALERQRGQVATNDKQKALEAELEATKAINAAKEEQRRLDESAANNIARLQDQIDLLSGAATKAEIAIREAMRAGLSEDQAKEIGRLTEELNRLQEAQNAPKEQQKPDKPEAIAKADRTTLRAAFAGSQEAASIMLRGVGGGKSIEQIAQKQLTVQQQTLTAIKANKPATLMPLTLGT